MSTQRALAQNVMRLVNERRLKVATAESCTGGQLSSLLTDIEGYSHCVECAFVTYSDRSKIELLAVSDQILAKFGPVSDATVRAMANGALKRSSADLVVAVTGFAGPAGPSDTPGLVHLALVDRWGTTDTLRRRYSETSRDAVRHFSITDALQMLLTYLLRPARLAALGSAPSNRSKAAERSI